MQQEVKALGTTKGGDNHKPQCVSVCVCMWPAETLPLVTQALPPVWVGGGCPRRDEGAAFSAFELRALWLPFLHFLLP